MYVWSSSFFLCQKGVWGKIGEPSQPRSPVENRLTWGPEMEGQLLVVFICYSMGYSSNGLLLSLIPMGYCNCPHLDGQLEDMQVSINWGYPQLDGLFHFSNPI